MSKLTRLGKLRQFFLVFDPLTDHFSVDVGLLRNRAITPLFSFLNDRQLLGHCVANMTFDRRHYQLEWVPVNDSGKNGSSKKDCFENSEDE